MNERQAFSAIRNILRLEKAAGNAAIKATPELRRAFEFLGLQIEGLPSGQIDREITYKQLSQQFAAAFRDANARMYQEVQQAVEDNVVDQYNWGEKYLRDGGVSVSPPVGEGPVGFSAQTQVPSRTQLQAITQETEVLGKRLDQLFGAGPSGVSPWAATQVDRIDRVVKQGFLLSETNEEIARNLSSALNQSLAESRAIARTAVMDMSQRAHNAFWDANDSVIAGWEFDASMDYRVCPQCAPNDGRTAKKRDELPQTPVHPNCRCMVLPLTETELALREKEGPQRRSVVELVEVKGNADDADKARAIKEARGLHKGTEARAYAKPVRVNGKKYWRVAVDVERGKRPLTMGEFLADATPATRANVLGSKKQADRFMGLISDRGKSTTAMSPDAALVEVTKGQRAPFKKGTRSALESPAVRKIKKSSPPAAPASKVAPVKKAPAPKPASAPTSKTKPKAPPSLQQEGKDVLSRVAPELNSYVSIERKAQIVLNARTQAMISAKTPEAKEVARKAYLRAANIENRAAAKVTKAMEKVRKEMLKTDLPKEIQKEYIDGIRFEGWGTKKKLINDTKKQVQEFIQMFNGQGFTATGSTPWVQRLEPDLMGRGFNRLNGQVAVRIGSKENLFHELMHTVEAQRPAMGREAREWILSKAYTLDSPKLPSALKGKEMSIRNGKPVFKLSDITGSSYRDEEVAWKDDFLNGYMGKDYGQDITEVWTVAVEHFTDSRTMGALFRRHPDLFQMMVGLSKRK